MENMSGTASANIGGPRPQVGETPRPDHGPGRTGPGSIAAEQVQSLCQAGASHLARDDFEAAHAVFAEAVRLGAGSPTALFGLAQAHRNLSRWPEAERAARAALAANPRSAVIAHYLAVLISEQDRTFEALPLFEAAHKLAPSDAQIHRDLGVTLLFVGEVARGQRPPRCGKPMR
jgi:Flp pilus assembly protein TadD